MIKTNSFLNNECIDLTKEMAIVQAKDTPFTTLMLNMKNVDDVSSKIVTWREKTLDTTEDISATEGSKTDIFQASNRAEKNNVCEIFKKAVQVSGSAQASSVTGITDLYESEINDRLAEMKINIEKAIINGVKNDGSLTPFVRKMDGILSFAPAENTVSAATLSEVNLKNTIKKLWDNGLGSSEFYCLLNADFKEAVDTIYKDQVRFIAPTDTFGIVARRIETNYGIVNFVLNRHMPIDKLVVFDPAFVRLAFLRKPFTELLAKDGDYISGHVISELTLKVLNQKAVAMFKKTA